MKTLCSSLAAIALLCSAVPASAQCLIVGGIDLGEIYTGSGNASVDEMVTWHGKVLSNMLGVKPTIRYSRSSDVNALAKPAVSSFSDGDVYLLKGVIDDCRSLDDDLRLIAVLAHEFGHIYCHKYWRGDDLSDVEEELYCDFIAGHYLMNFVLLGKGYDPRPEVVNAKFDRLMPLLRSQGRYGDYYFNSPTHHGTPDERERAMRAPFGCLSDFIRMGLSGPGPHFVDGKWMSSNDLTLYLGHGKIDEKGRY